MADGYYQPLPGNYSSGSSNFMSRIPRGLTAQIAAANGGGVAQQTAAAQPYTIRDPAGYGSFVGTAGTGGAAAGGEVKNLPFQKRTSSMPNMGVLNPAFQSQKDFLQQASPDYSTYFQQLSGQAFEDANRQSARLASQHGGAPTASTGNTGMNQGAYQGMLFDQLNKANVDRMWTTQDQWEQNKYNQGANAYQNYFNALASKAYDTDESGFQSGIYNPSGGGGQFDPYAGTSARGGSGGSGSGSGSGGGAGAGAGNQQGQTPGASLGYVPGSAVAGSPSGSSPMNEEWGDQVFNPSNPYLGMGDLNDPNYGRQTGEGWLNGGSGYGTPNGDWGEPVEDTGNLNSYLQEIAQSGAGTESQGTGHWSSPFFTDPSQYSTDPNKYKGQAGITWIPD